MQHTNLIGIGKKQIGQSSFAGGSSNSASSRSSAQHVFCSLFMLRPMIPLTLGVAIFDKLHDLHVLRLTTSPSFWPHYSVQQLFVVIAFNLTLLLLIEHAKPRRPQYYVIVMRHSQWSGLRRKPVNGSEKEIKRPLLSSCTEKVSGDTTPRFTLHATIDVRHRTGLSREDMVVENQRL